MNTLAKALLSIAVFSLTMAAGAADRQPDNRRVKLPGPAAQEMMLGTWAIKVKYEPSPEWPNGAEASGKEAWRVGPGGYSIIEEYLESNSKGGFAEINIAWWDAKEKGQRFVACDRDEKHPCEMSRSVARWQGNDLVYTDEVNRAGARVVRQEVFTEITPTTFTQVLKEGPSESRLKTTTTIRATKISDRPEPLVY